MNKQVVDIQTLREAKLLASIHRKMNGTHVKYSELVESIEKRKSKNIQKSDRINHDTQARLH